MLKRFWVEYVVFLLLEGLLQLLLIQVRNPFLEFM